MIYELEGDYYVRPLRESDIDGPYTSWFEDQEVCRFNSHGKFFKTKSSFADYIRDTNREDRVVWAICHKTDGHIGNVSLSGLSFINRTAEFAIILGDRRHWGKGVGVLAGRAMLQHGFTKLNLERVYFRTAATNMSVVKKLAVGMCMTLEGRLRKHLFLEGERVDVLEYGVLREEFSSSQA